MNSSLYDDQFAVRELSGSLSSARVMAPLVIERVEVQSVLDVGCGNGAWLRAFRDLGVPVVEGWDGARFAHDQYLVEPSNVHTIDLTCELPVRDPFDLVICLEVAEHLEPRHAGRLVRSLCGLGATVLFSAAVPGQTGTGHVNEQYLSYWVDLFAAHGFVLSDVLRAQVWTNPDVEWWYRQNAVLFSSEGLEVPSSGPIDIIHPELWNLWRDRTEAAPSLRNVLHALPGASTRAIRRRLRA